MAFTRKKLEITPPYVSMADIAFNLVLFFLILAKTQEEKPIEWTVVKTTGTEKISNARVVVSVDNQNRKYLNGEEIGQQDLAIQLAKLAEESPENRKVLLKIHAETQAATFNPIMEAVSAAGCEIVHVLEEGTDNTAPK
jgi:biopolymer transport protein ExbD